jgi:ferredoxin
MTYVITRLCQDCVDGACVAVCPIDNCIVEHRPNDGGSALPNQLFINPDACIHCAACEPECPWEAIYDEDEVPSLFQADIALNAISAAKPDQFVTAGIRATAKPSAEVALANMKRWR